MNIEDRINRSSAPGNMDQGTRRITVDQKGKGDFQTIGEALGSIPENNLQQVVIFIRNGCYKEQLEVKSPFIRMQGEDREKTVITSSLYANMPEAVYTKLGTFRSYSVLIDTHDFYAGNLTFENSAGPGREVGQAIALYVDGDRIVFENCRMTASQDTLFTGPLPPKEIEKNGFVGPKQHAPRINGRHLYKDCLIRGDIDFIFGSGTAYFENCEIFSQDIKQEVNGYVTAASTPEGQDYGYVFNGCSFIGDAPEGTVYLGRPWRNFAKTVILNSYMGGHICKAGWHDWNKADARSTVYYGEYGNFGPGSDVTQRPEWVKRLDSISSLDFTRDKVLKGGDGWSPVPKQI